MLRNGSHLKKKIHMTFFLMVTLLNGHGPLKNPLLSINNLSDSSSRQGDNGGGLRCWDSVNGQNVVSGLLSWRTGCAEPNMPGVYMNVAHYLDWISSVIS